jgi:hypothetical protein
MEWGFRRQEGDAAFLPSPQGLCRSDQQPLPLSGFATGISIMPVTVHFLGGSDL